MRILIYGINYHPELTGIGKYSGEMADWLARQGHEVRVVTAVPYYPAWRVTDGYSAWRYCKENICGVAVWRSPLWVPQNPRGLNRIIHLFSFSVTSTPIMLWQIRWRPDIVLVVAPTILNAPLGFIVAKMSSARAWLHVQDFEMDVALGLGLIKMRGLGRMVGAVESSIMRLFDRVSTISGKMIERLISKGVESNKCILFPNWVNTDLVFPIDEPSMYRRALSIQDDSIVALYAGNMGKKQGLELIIDAAKCLQHNKNITFVLAGEGAMKNSLCKMASGLSNIRWMPLQPMEKLNELLNMADIHLLPQSAGAADLVLPSKLTGMLASGRPVIATASSGTQLAKNIEKCGRCIDPDDIEAFVSAIEELSENPELRNSLGKEARRHAVEFLDYHIIMRQFEDELLSLVIK